MKILIIFICVFIILLPGISEAKIWYVKPDSTGQVINIQAGIDSCGPGDTVLAAPGIFKGDGNRDLDFRGKPIVVLAACRFNSTITDSTIIDCEKEKNHRGFYFHSGETNSAIIEGLIIENAYSGYDGGGILCDSSSCPTIQYNVIRHCRSWRGGAICSYSSSPVIKNNKIYDDGELKWPGGAIYCKSSSVVFKNNEIYDNGSGSWGGGILCDSCSLVVENNDVYDNLHGGIGLFDSDAIIHNNRIRNNNGSDKTNGGIGCHNSTAIITNNEITENYTYFGGCAIGAYNSVVTVDNNYIYNNRSGDSGMIVEISSMNYITSFKNNIIVGNGGRGYEVLHFTSSDSLYIINNTIINNSAHTIIVCSSPGLLIEGNVIKENRWASCISCISSTPVIRGNIITTNLILAGGAIACYSSSPTVVNNTISDNKLRDSFGIFIDNNSLPVISKNIICNNIFSDYCDYDCYAGGIYVEDSTTTISCNNVYNNDGGNYIGIPDQTGINGNISIDPIFCYPENGEYTLHIQSPCLPGNHPDGADCGLIGALGEGCDYIATLLQEYHATVYGSDITIRWTLVEYDEDSEFHILRAELPSGEYIELSASHTMREGLTFIFDDRSCEPGITYRYRIDVEDGDGRRLLFETDALTVPSLPLTLYQNYPNPFNPYTTIRYYLPEKSLVSLNIYDVTGKRIVCLLDDNKDEGFHNTKWEGRDNQGNPVSSGVYFYKLQAGKGAITRKMVLLR